MSVENNLKERLSLIAKNDYRVADETEVWPLAIRMVHSLGSTDPELRDILIFTTLDQWTDLYFDSKQLRELLSIVLDDEHLFLGLGEQESDSVFMRSFSSLAIASFMARHRTHPFLSAQAVEETHRRMLTYLSRERDLRGHVPVKGWAHAVAHAADALGQLALCSELGEQSLLDMLRVIRETIVNACVVFVDEEDERLVEKPVLRAIQRQVLKKAEITGWISDFASFGLPPTYQEWLRKKTNIKNFMRSLYFRSLYRGIIDSLEPALSETLKDISNREIPSIYF